MIASLRRLLRLDHARQLPALPPGQRAYAIGDIHGRADLLARLIDGIEADDAARNASTPCQTTMILLGDLIDRGPDSAGVIALARAWQQRRPVRILAGNHEEMLLEGLERLEVLRHLLQHGGRETALSFGVDAQAYLKATWEEAQALLRAAVPADVLDFLRSFEDHVQLGDYLFVHAGIRPGVPIEAQTPADLRWIREPFLSCTDSHGAVIVHGHTITDEPALRPNRIGIDTGAFQSGRLTALGLEGTRRWLIEARETDGVISLSHTGLN
ncbi:MAG TPA: metallophosphoesterase family protein [Novosphingobium sp.]|nr:metallophosphoesterase family protein [Novosphingobium sp.]